MLQIKASITAGVRPTTMIVGADSRKKWSSMDVLLLLAYEILQNERCSQCGGYRWLCHNEDQRLQVRVKSDYCYAKAMLEEHEQTRSKAKEKSYEGPVYPEFYMRDETPLHKLRGAYFQSLGRDEDSEEEPD